MSHLSSQPPEIMAENLSQSPRSARSAWEREKRFADVLGRRMAYIERGVGHPFTSAVPGTVNYATFDVACRSARGGTFENSELSPSAIVGCAKAALARLV
jgi:hypothetical protein